MSQATSPAPAAPAPAASPTTAPSAPPTAAPSAGSGTPPSPAPAPSRSTAFDGIDDIVGTDNPDSGHTPAADASTGLPASTAPDPATSKTADAPPEGGKKAGLGDDLDPLLGKQSKAPKELRSAYERTTAELAAAKAKLTEFEQRIGSAKTEAEKAVAAQIQELTGKLTAYEQRMQLLDFRSSEAYQRDFAKPADDAWQAAAAALRGVKVENADGSERPISAQDIMDMVILDPADAWTAAQKFGAHAPLIHRHVEAIRDKETAKQNAVKEWGEKGKAHQEQLQREQESMRQEWESGTEEIMNQRASDLGISDPSPEVKALLDHGAKLAKIAFLGGADRATVLNAQKLAAVRVRTFGAILNRATAAEARVAELEAKLSQYEAGDPPVGGAGAPAGGAGRPRTAEEEIDAIPGTDHPG